MYLDANAFHVYKYTNRWARESVHMWQQREK